VKQTGVAALLGLFALAMGPAPRAADRLSGTRGTIEERSHLIRMTIGPGHATLVVERTIENLGKRHDQADWSIFIPDSAVATRLRTRGLLDGKRHWFEGDLMEAEEAAARYKELTGIGGYYPKDPALLSWRARGELALQVFPVPPLERKTVSYTLEMPTVYRGGRHELTLPLLGLVGELPQIVVRSQRPADRIVVAGQPFPSGARVQSLVGPEYDMELGEHPPSEAGIIALVPGDAPTLGGALGVKRFADDRVLVHYRIEAAPKVARVPRDAQVVVILDGSRSMPEAAARAALAGAAATLRHFESASVEILVFDRRVHPRYGQLVPVARAIADLEALEPPHANGSNVDAALARADQILAAAPAGKPRRVLLLSDLLTRESLKVSGLRTALRRSGALLHVGHVEETGEPALAVEGDGDWSTVARATGGLAWNAVLSGEPGTQAKQRAMLEEWARPVRLHRFRVVLPGVALAPATGESWLEEKVLDEGQGVAGLQIADYAPPWLEMVGELWSRSVRVRLAPDPADGRLWSALVFGDRLMDELSEPEMMVLARHGGAVSPVTSYLAIEPGVRPSTEGLEEEAVGVGGLGLVGTGASGASICGMAEARPRFDHAAWLRNALDPARAKCGFEKRRVALTVETTRAEVVDIRQVEAPSPGDRACLVEAAWRLDLPAAFREQHAHYQVELGGAPVK
jgi:hypothetical protein